MPVSIIYYDDNIIIVIYRFTLATVINLTFERLLHFFPSRRLDVSLRLRRRG